MARLAYYAPGVYVEEIPSARQPIAGVGTNTVGFIGLVPDVVYIPVPNPDYDPVLTRNLLDFARLASEIPQNDLDAEKRRKQLEKLENEFQDKLTTLTKEIDDLTKKQPGHDQAVKDADAEQRKAVEARDALPNNATKDEKSLASAALQAAQRKLLEANAAQATTVDSLAEKKQLRKDIEQQLADAKAAAAPAAATAPAVAGATGAPVSAPAPANGGAGAEITDFKGQKLPADSPLLKPSALRPYTLVPQTVKAPQLATKLCTNFTEYANLFGDFSGFDPETRQPISTGHHLLTHAISGFFANGGTRAFVCRVSSDDVKEIGKALERFESIDDIAILAAPGLPAVEEVWDKLQSYCEDDAHQNVFAILDPPAVVADEQGNFDIEKLKGQQMPRASTHAAYYFPHIEVSDPAKRLQDGDPAWQVPAKYRGRTYVAPSGHMAGIYARTDEERGVHKAPANTAVRGALEVKYYISKPKQELLNPQGVNCIRLINGDVNVWGARTIGGDRNGEWKYVSVRRFAGFLAESIDRGTQWVVFEPNDPKLWSKIVLNITAFLTNVWRSGALFGLTPQEAFYVKCDAELNTETVRDLGQVITEIGVAIVRPAEFVIFRISQSAGQQQG
jgi:phage tail sheath protein FI